MMTLKDSFSLFGTRGDVLLFYSRKDQGAEGKNHNRR